MNFNVASYLQKMAAEHPDKIALKVPKKRYSKKNLSYHVLSFSELNHNANCCAEGMSKAGVEPGKRVLMMVRPGKEMLTFAFALFKVGAVPILIDPGMGLKSMVNCVKRTKPEVLVGIPEAHLVSFVYRKYFSKIEIRVTVGKRLGWKGERYSEMLIKNTGQYDDYIAKKNDLAAILFTSGSTGSPKGVCYEHGHFHTQLDLLKNYFKIEAGGVDLPMLPIFTLFNPALGLQTVVPKMHPGKPAKFNPKYSVTAIIDEKITQSFGSPVLWKKIVHYCEKENLILESLKLILIAGAPVPPVLLQTLKKITPNAKIHTPYGATEALPIACIESDEILTQTKTYTESGRGMCVGLALPGIKIRIIESHTEKIKTITEAKNCKVGEIGEIIVFGDNVTSRYDENNEATESAKIVDGDRVWHRMGDLGYQDEQNRLWFCGRKSHCVQSKYGKFYSVCCEAIFNAHPEVERSALIRIEKESESHPALVVESKKINSSNAKQIAGELEKLAQAYEHTRAIKTFYCNKSFPVDVRHNAKINREELSEWASDQKDLANW